MRILKLQNKRGLYRGKTADDRLTVQWLTGKTIVPEHEVASLQNKAPNFECTVEIEVVE